MVKKFFQEPTPMQVFLVILFVNSMVGLLTGTLIGAVVGTFAGVVAGPFGSWIGGILVMLIQHFMK